MILYAITKLYHQQFIHFKKIEILSVKLKITKDKMKTDYQSRQLSGSTRFLVPEKD